MSQPVDTPVSRRRVPDGFEFTEREALPQVMVLREVAAWLRIGYTAAWQLCDSGQLRHRRLGSGRHTRLLVTKQALFEFIDGPDPAQVDEAAERLVGGRGR